MATHAYLFDIWLIRLFISFYSKELHVKEDAGSYQPNGWTKLFIANHELSLISIVFINATAHHLALSDEEYTVFNTFCHINKRLTKIGMWLSTLEPEINNGEQEAKTKVYHLDK